MYVKDRPCTTKQVDFIAMLVKEREISKIQDAVDAARTAVMEQTFTAAQASALIDKLLLAPKRNLKPKAELADGIYVRTNGDQSEIYKVYRAVHGSGRQVFKAWDFKTESWGYIGGVSCLPRDGVTRMTAEQASMFGHVYGMCVVCGRTLTDEDSIARGIGPVCAEKF